MSRQFNMNITCKNKQTNDTVKYVFSSPDDIQLFNVKRVVTFYQYKFDIICKNKI